MSTAATNSTWRDDLLGELDPEGLGFSPPRLARIDAWLDGYVKRGLFEGMSLVVLRNGRLAYRGAAGLSDPDTDRPMDLDTICRIYSMTKPVTGVAMMILLERGHYLLDDPIAEALPEFAEPRVLDGNRSRPARGPVTFRHLLTHTAGLSYGFLDSDPVARRMVEQKLDGVPGQVRADSLEDWCRKLAKLPLAFEPGSRWHYSVAMDVLGRLVEVLDGRSFPKFLLEEIFDPLQMHDTSFFVPETKRDRFARCFSLNEAGERIAIERKYSPFHEPPAVPLGGGGLTSTIPDYLRFTEMLRRGGELDGTRVLAPATVALMTADHLASMNLDPEHRTAPLSTLPSMDTFRGEGFGLTGMVSVDPVGSGILGPPGQFAWGGAASTSFWIDRVNGLSVVQFAQLLPSSAYPLRPQARNLVYQALID